jgi:flagellar protein FlaG
MGSVDSILRSSIENVKLESSRLPQAQERQISNLDQQPSRKSETEVREKEIEKVVSDINTVLGNTHTSLKYVYHEKLQKYYVTLIDDETKETVREIPPKKLLDMYASMQDYLGLFVDNKI